MQYPLISPKVLVDDWLDVSQEEGQIDEQLLYKFVNQAAGMLTTDEWYEESIALFQVKNYKVELPENFRYVIQAAYNAEYDKHSCTREEIVQWTQRALDGSGCKVYIDFECPRCHQTECSCKTQIINVDINRVYEQSHPELYTSYMSHFYTYGGTTQRGTQSYYHPQFYLMRRKSGSFHNIPYHIDKCVNLDVDSEIEYTIDLPYLIVNFERGQVLLSYVGTKVDQDGNLMIPNNEYVIDAIVKYIEERLAYGRYRKSGGDSDYRFYQMALQLKEKAMRTAKAKLQQPSQDEWKVFLDNYWRKLIPYHHYEQNMRRFKRDDAIPEPRWIP